MVIVHPGPVPLSSRLQRRYLSRRWKDSGGNAYVEFTGTARVDRIMLANPTVKDKTVVQYILKLRWILLEGMMVEEKRRECQGCEIDSIVKCLVLFGQLEG